MKRPNLLATEFETIKQSIIYKFRNDPDSPFSDYDYEGSSLSYLIDILSYVTQYNNYYGQVAVNENYLPSTQVPKNVYSLARSLGYLPKRPTSAEAFIRVELQSLPSVDTTKDVVIPTYSTLKSGKGFNYILMEDITFRYNTAQNKWMLIQNDIFDQTDDPYYYRVKQGQFLSTTYNPSEMSLQRFIIDHTNIENSHDAIIIQDSVTYKYWTPFYDISDFNLDGSQNDLFTRLTDVDDLRDEIIINDIWDNFILDMGESEIFFVNGDESGTYVSFGDNTLGKIPENLLNVYYILSEGPEGNGDTTFTINGILNYDKLDGSTGTVAIKNSQVTIMSNTSSTGGSLAETIESIKKLAPAFFNSQNREVTTKDYEVHLKQQQSVPLKNIMCIGGENLKPIIMGAVGVCANKYSNNNNIKNSLLNEGDKELLRLIIKNKNVVTINPVFLNPEFVKININTKLFYNPLVAEDHNVYDTGKATINTYMNSISGFNKYFKSSNLIMELDEEDLIDHNLTEADMEYLKIIQKSEIIDTMFVNFGNKNILKEDSIAKIKEVDYFMKVFNSNTYYNTVDLLAPNGTSSFSSLDYDNPASTGTSIIHKIFLYDIVEEYDEESEEYGKLYLVEYHPKTLQAERIDGSDSFPFFFNYNEAVETGKKKLIGEIYYNRGLIRLYFDNTAFRYLDINKKSPLLALATMINYEVATIGTSSETIRTVINIDPEIDGYSDYDSLFFTEYDFDAESNLPWNYDGANWIPNIPTPTTEYDLTFAFDTEHEDFESMGNIIISTGRLVIERYKEANKK